MDKATEPKPPAGGGGKQLGRGSWRVKLSIHEERTLKAAAPVGSRFKGYADVVSDDAGQFAVGRHALCWVHAERLMHKLEAFSDHDRVAQKRVRGLIWCYYSALKRYQSNSSPARRTQLLQRFDRIFNRRTGWPTLDRLLKRLNANKPELLMVLDRPQLALHTNGSENDIRCQVIKRKISGGTRSDTGRDCPDAFLGLAKTCAKLNIAFRDYLGARLAAPGSPQIPFLAELVGIPAPQPP